ncbi:9102_t:CDS:2 [Entrophospora sp. SA101]|nr:3941_t:CDS:2 [Entrophospora sp. SA101]CAJ0844974.1 9102_t:CDS:2 [Entrophospora sp. SA101]
MTVINRLNAKKTELEVRLNNLYHGGSNRRETLQHKIKKIKELITAYQSTSAPVNLSEAKNILNQQVGFEEQKEKILNSLRIKGYCEQRDIQQHPQILCLIGPPGVGKTTFGQLLAQALKKEFFAVSLGSVSDNSVLVGANESLSGSEIGQLTKALAETKSHDPLILLDEIDKVGSYKTGSAIHGCLNSILDPVQNQEILDHYIDVKLDFSKVTFIITANDRITSEALENLINKTKEKGVRQLKSALDSIFDHCLLQWAQEASQGKSESKIIINSDLINQIISNDFFNVDLESNSENKNQQKELELLRKELEKSKEEKNNKSELKVIKFNSLLVLRQIRGQFDEKEYLDYEGKINSASSREEIEIIEKEFLLNFKQKNASPKPVRRKEDQKEKDKLAEIEQQNKVLTGQLQLNNDELEQLKKEIQNLQKQKDNDKTILRTKKQEQNQKEHLRQQLIKGYQSIAKSQKRQAEDEI